MVAEIISKSAKGEKRIYAQELDKANSDEIALYIGSKQTIKSITKSVNIYTNVDIITKALNDEPFDYNTFASQWYDNRGISATEYTPVFLIKNKMDISFDSCGVKFKKNYEKRKEFFLGFSPNSTINNQSELISEYNTMKKNQRPYISICNRICSDLIALLHKNNISEKDYKNMLKKILHDYELAVSTSPFKWQACVFL